MSLIKSATFGVVTVLFCISNVKSQEWRVDFKGGVEPAVYALSSIDDKLFVGGSFLHADTLDTRWIAIWDSIDWSVFPTSLEGGAVYVVGKLGNIVVGGTIYSYSWLYDNIARFDSSGWSALSSMGSPNGQVKAMKLFDNKLFFSGEFGAINGALYPKVAAYDGTNYIQVSDMSMNYGSINALEVYNGCLYAGGTDFGIRQYSGGTSWLKTMGDVFVVVNALKTDTFNNFLYVGGGLYGAIYNGDTTWSSCMLMWDGQKWNSMGIEIDCDVYAIAIYRGYVYVGGCMDTLLNGTPVNYISRWDGYHWQPVGEGTNVGIMALEVYKDELYVGGGFTTAGGDSAYAIARIWAPDTGCFYMQPRVFTVADTFYLSGGSANVQFFNNNAYADTWNWDFGDGSGNASVQNPVYTYTDSGTYTVTVTVTHNTCTKTAEKTIVVLINTGTETYIPEDFKLNIYPNPTTGDITAECNIPPGMNNAQIMVNDSFGSEKFKRELQPGLNKFEIRSSIWSKGWYVAGVYAGNKQVVVKKFVKE